MNITQSSASKLVKKYGSSNAMLSSFSPRHICWVHIPNRQRLWQVLTTFRNLALWGFIITLFHKVFSRFQNYRLWTEFIDSRIDCLKFFSGLALFANTLFFILWTGAGLIWFIMVLFQTPNCTTLTNFFFVGSYVFLLNGILAGLMIILVLEWKKYFFLNQN